MSDTATPTAEDFAALLRDAPVTTSRPDDQATVPGPPPVVRKAGDVPPFRAHDWGELSGELRDTLKSATAAVETANLLRGAGAVESYADAQFRQWLAGRPGKFATNTETEEVKRHYRQEGAATVKAAVAAASTHLSDAERRVQLAVAKAEGHPGVALPAPDAPGYAQALVASQVAAQRVEQFVLATGSAAKVLSYWQLAEARSDTPALQHLEALMDAGLLPAAAGADEAEALLAMKDRVRAARAARVAPALRKAQAHLAAVKHAFSMLSAVDR